MDVKLAVHCEQRSTSSSPLDSIIVSSFILTKSGLSATPAASPKTWRLSEAGFLKLANVCRIVAYIHVSMHEYVPYNSYSQSTIHIASLPPPSPPTHHPGSPTKSHPRFFSVQRSSNSSPRAQGTQGPGPPPPPSPGETGRNKEGAAQRVQPTGCSPGCAPSPSGRWACRNFSDHCPLPKDIHLHPPKKTKKNKKKPKKTKHSTKHRGAAGVDQTAPSQYHFGPTGDRGVDQTGPK